MEEIKNTGFGSSGFLGGLFGGNFLTIIIIFFLLMLLFGDGFCIFGEDRQWTISQVSSTLKWIS